MKKLMTLVLVLLVVPVLFAKNSDVALKEVQEGMDGPYAPVDQSPVRPMVQTSRGLGDILLTIDALALGIDGPSGITWDGTYLYVMSLMNDSCYVVDPTVPAVVYGFPTPPTNSFGIGQEQNLWLTCLTTDSIYEYTHAGVPSGNGFSALAGGASWFADGSEWWQDGEIWFIAVGGTKKAYKFEVPSGAVLDSIGHPRWLIDSQRGITYDPFKKTFWIGGWVSDSVWEVDRNGVPTGRAFYMDGCAGIAYDWQSTLHPYPVLWICRQAADEIVMVDPDNLPITWDFETGLQGWTHTNGAAFPEGWDVESYDLHSNAMSPDPGDSSMWIDSDAAGSGVLINDTAWSPLIVPTDFTVWLKWGCGYQNLAGIDTFSVGIRAMVGGVWQDPVRLQVYSTDIGPDIWDSVDVSAYQTADLLQIFFAYNYADYAWYASFDNVSINAVFAQHDAVCYPVYSPSGGIIPPGNYDVTARIRNFGDYTETFNVTANVYDTTDAWNLVHTQMVTLTDFPPDGDSIVNFGSVNLDESVYYTEVYTALAGDNNPANDTSSVYTATLMTFDLVYDFESGWQGWTHTNGLAFPEAWDVLESGYKPTWAPPDAGDSCLWIDSDAAGSGVLVQDTALSPVILPDHETEYLKYGIGFNWLGSDTLDIGVKYFDGSAWNAVQLLRHHIDINPMWEIIDVSGYNTYDSVQVYFYYQGTYDWYVAIDNVMINEGETGIAERPADKERFIFGFVPNISNPIKEHATISYGTTMQGKVSLRIYDASGRLVRTLVNKHEPAGAKTVFWNGRDDGQRKVADGIYFLRLEAEDRVDTRKMIFVR